MTSRSRSAFDHVRRQVLHFALLAMVGLVVCLAVFQPRPGVPTGELAAQRLLQVTQATGLAVRWGLSPALILAGVVIGIFMGMLGMGGGVFKVSCMLIVFEMDILLARAVSIVTMFFASSTALWQHVKTRPVIWSYAWPTIVGAAPGAILGALLGNSLSSPTLTKIFGLFTLFLAFTVVGLVFGDPHEGALEEDFDRTPDARTTQICTGVGGVHGLVSGLLGISGGVVACPAQQMLVALPLRDAITNTLLGSAVATGIASVLVLVTGVSRGDYALSEVAFVATLMGLGCAIGAPIGARIGRHVPVIVLHLIDFVLVFGAGLSILN